MQLLRSLTDFPTSLCGGAVAIGNFDGVHRGHARIVERLRARAKEVGGPAIVFTFDPHPVRLLRPEHAPPPLTWTDRKAELLEQLGVDAMIAYPTDEALLALGPQQFFSDIVENALAAKAMVEGPNFYFGKGRAGSIEVLRALCDESKISLDIVEPLKVGDDFVSSSRVRKLIQAGDVSAAAELLTQPYRIRGMVTHGAGRGAKLGFPTANLDAIDTLLPAHGVYAGRAILPKKIWPAAINLGPNPTFGEQAVKVEVHLVGFAGSLYGQPMEVDFIARLRDIRRFGGIDELKTQLHEDVVAARKVTLSE